MLPGDIPFFLDYILKVQLMTGARVAALKSRPVLHHCVIYVSGPLAGIMY